MRSLLPLTFLVANAVSFVSAGEIVGALEHTGEHGGDFSLDGGFEEGFSVSHGGEYVGGKSYIITRISEGHGGGFGRGIFSLRGGHGIGGLLGGLGRRSLHGASGGGETYIINTAKGVSDTDHDGVYDGGHEVGWW